MGAHFWLMFLKIGKDENSTVTAVISVKESIAGNRKGSLSGKAPCDHYFNLCDKCSD